MFTLDRLESRQLLNAVLVDGTLTVTGTNAGETIYVESAGNHRIRAAINTTSLGLFKADQVQRIVIDGGGGNDSLRVEHMLGISGTTLLGGAGNDYLFSWIGSSFLHGGPGNDSIHASNGRDTLVGGSGDDLLVGGPGPDVLNGSTGNDTAVREGRDVINLVESVGPARWYVDVPGMPYPLSMSFEQKNGSVVALIDVTFWDGGSHMEITSVRRSGGHVFITGQVKRVAGDAFVTGAVTERRYRVALGRLPAGQRAVTFATHDGLFSIRKGVDVST